MNFLSKAWHWFLDEKNRGALVAVGAGVAAVVTALWAVFKYARKRKDTPQNAFALNRNTRFDPDGAVQYIERMDGGSQTINAGPSAEQIQAIIRPHLAVHRDQATQIVELSRQLGISEAAVGGFFATLGEGEVPPERWAAVLAQIAQRHLSLLERLASLPTEDATIQKKTQAAREALELGDHQRAEKLLEECEQLDLEASQHSAEDAKTRLCRAIETRAARGELAMTRIDYRAAAVHFGRAAELAAGLESEVQNRFLHERGYALYMQGTERGDNTAIAEAVEARRDLLSRLSRDRDPLNWAATLTNLGNALARLGQREGGTARLEEAVEAYREALKAYTRDGVPLKWAGTQNNLGEALRNLGKRERGTAKLEEAVVAFREALKERTRNRVPLEWAMTQNNLGSALLALGERESGIAKLEEAVVAYREALEERPRDRVPLDWAMTQNNLGTALLSLGEREGGSAKLEEAVVALREALKEYTRDRVPLDWAMTQNNLGSALERLGVRESGTARLEEAVAAYREALTVYQAAEADHYVAGVRENLQRAELLLDERR